VDRGYVDASVESSARFLDPVPPEGERAEVTYTVAEGQPVTFGKTILRGNRRTQPFIVEDRLANKEGSPFSLTKLLETQQNLARLGMRPDAVNAVREALPMMERDLFDAVLEDHACEVAAIEEALYQLALALSRAR
jgi:outer membrane protein assembly factor BamA